MHGRSLVAAALHEIPALGARALRELGAALCISLALAGCTRSVDTTTGSPTGNPVSDTLHLTIPKSPESLNPLLTTTTTEQQLSHFAFDTLIVPDADNRIVPRLAQSVPTRANGGISPDGKTVTFHLRHDVRWHDGRPFTSADVAFTWAEIRDPKVNITSRTGFDRIVAVTTPDAYTVVAHLREAFAPFVSYAGYQYPIVPKHLLERSADVNRDPFGTHPIGTGPYVFVRWDHGSRIEYAANRAYFGGAPKIAKLSVAEIEDQNTVALELRTHQLDLAVVEPPAFEQLKTIPELRSGTEPQNNFTAYALNVTSPVLRDVRVRRALSMAIDRDSLVRKQTFGNGTAAYADLPTAFFTRHAPVSPYGYDPAAANALLDAAGWKRGPTGIREKDGLPLRLRGVDVSGFSTEEKIDIAVGQMLRAVGVDWSVKYYSASLYYETKANGGPVASGKFDIANYQFFSSIDPQNDEIYTCGTRPPNGYNFAFYCSPEMDALQHESLTTLDPARRLGTVAKIERLAVTDAPYLFLFHTPWLLVWNPHLVRTHTNVSDPFYDASKWSFEAR